MVSCMTTLLDSIISKIIELEDTLRRTHPISQDFYEELLIIDYMNCVWTLNSIDSMSLWGRIIELQERHDAIGAKLPNVSDAEFEEYIVVGDLLAVSLAVVS